MISEPLIRQMLETNFINLLVTALVIAIVMGGTFHLLSVRSSDKRYEKQLRLFEVERNERLTAQTVASTTIATMQGRLDGMERRLFEVEAERIKLRERLATVETERNALQSRLDAAERREQTTRDLLTKTTTELSQLQVSYREQGARIEKLDNALKTELNTSAQLRHDIETIKLEKQALTRRVAELETENAALRLKIAELEKKATGELPQIALRESAA